MRKDLGEKKELKEQKNPGHSGELYERELGQDRAGQHVPCTGHRDQSWYAVIHSSAKRGRYWGAARKSAAA